MADDVAKTVSRDESGRKSDPPSFDAHLVGKVFAGCRIRKKLGAGAMGVVYLAEQLSLGRLVAVKILDPKFSRDPSYIERFEREAQSAAQLTHFHIVRVFDYGREDDLYYILSEYVDGGNVQNLIDAEGMIPPLRATEIIHQAAEGLAAAHEIGVIHRDIKPDNLMLTKGGLVKIADFGLAKRVADDAAVTQAGMIVGTPFYMSPEQAKGIELDARSDIYSLGVTYFHMVTGRLPFEADSVIGVLLKQISAERPDPLTINPTLPPSIGNLILRMMAREPADRFPTTRELVRALEKVLDSLKGLSEQGEELSRGAEELSSALDDRFARYKTLPAHQILDVSLETSPLPLTEAKRGMTHDTGVFLESVPAWPPETFLRIRFQIPDRKELFDALGVVRWVSKDPLRPGVGVTFLRVRPVTVSPARPSSSRFAASQATPLVRESAPPSGGKPTPPPSLPPEDMILELTATPLHARLLRYYYANLQQTVPIKKIANAMGVGMRMLAKPIENLLRFGLAAKEGEENLAFLWPEDTKLQKEIIAWISKYGLR